jgi:hypothetical protein
MKTKLTIFLFFCFYFSLAGNEADSLKNNAKYELEVLLTKINGLCYITAVNEIEGAKHAFSFFIEDGKQSIMVSAFIFSLMSGDPLVAATGEALTYTDADDIAVLTAGIHVNGEPATKLDYAFATAGTALPLVAGGVIGDIFKWFNGPDLPAVSLPETSAPLAKVSAPVVSVDRAFKRMFEPFRGQFVGSWTSLDATLIIDVLIRQSRTKDIAEKGLQKLRYLYMSLKGTNPIPYVETATHTLSGSRIAGITDDMALLVSEHLKQGQIGILTMTFAHGSSKFVNVVRDADGFKVPRIIGYPDALHFEDQTRFIEHSSLSFERAASSIVESLQPSPGPYTLSFTITGNLPE